MRLGTLVEAMRIASGALRASKLRSALTVLGVVIGVSTVMAMASIVQGIRDQIVNTIEVAGPTTFYVMRFWSTTPLNPDALPYEVRIRPVLNEREARAVGKIPEIEYAALWVQVFQRLEYQGVRTQLMTIFGADDRYMELQGGTLLSGRFFTVAEERRGEPVVVLEENTAEKLFGRMDPLGRWIRISGNPMRVIGLYRTPDNIFQPPSQQIAAIVRCSRPSDPSNTMKRTPCGLQ